MRTDSPPNPIDGRTDRINQAQANDGSLLSLVEAAAFQVG